MMKTAELGLAQEWDKTFPKSEKVEHSNPLSQYRVPSVRSRNKAPVCMRRRWRSAVI